MGIQLSSALGLRNSVLTDLTMDRGAVLISGGGAPEIEVGDLASAA